MQEGLSQTLTKISTTLSDLAKDLITKEAQLRDRERVIEKRERQIESSFQRCDDLDDTDLITFNVGGQHFMYTIDQIELHPDSMFACLVSERWNKRSKNKGSNVKDRIFNIARSARLFRYFDDYLRSGSAQVDQDELEAVKEEGRFYGLDIVTAKDELLPPLSWEWRSSKSTDRYGKHVVGGASETRGYYASQPWDPRFDMTWKVRVKGSILLGVSAPPAKIIAYQTETIRHTTSDKKLDETLDVPGETVLTLSLKAKGREFVIQKDGIQIYSKKLEGNVWVPSCLLYSAKSEVELLH